ncbi:hypothetical protein [Bradyrhizobium semiaridum]|uniref:hypothetical protein n=1 Tax=Bradyrhizobium semiaridum TaxID=2821404 RepID=UPI001CE2DF82|nr:hypothetical protein [Bradyrhizobium semiaridum]
MKSIVSAIAIVVLAGLPAQAQEHTTLPGIIVGAPPPVNLNRDGGNGAGRAATGRGTGQERCGDAAASGGQSLGCINERLRQQVDRVNPPVTNTAPIDAKSQDLKVGVVNVPAVQQQYGRNFGVSAFPYRPAAPVYTSPVGHR